MVTVCVGRSIAARASCFAVHAHQTIVGIGSIIGAAICRSCWGKRRHHAHAAVRQTGGQLIAMMAFPPYRGAASQAVGQIAAYGLRHLQIGRHRGYLCGGDF